MAHHNNTDNTAILAVRQPQNPDWKVMEPYKVRLGTEILPYLEITLDRRLAFDRHYRNVVNTPNISLSTLRLPGGRTD